MAKNKRTAVNLASLIVTCGVLVIAVRLSNAGFIGQQQGFAYQQGYTSQHKGFAYQQRNTQQPGFRESITKITDSLDKALLDMNGTVEYRTYNGSEKYYSNTSFSPKGMAGLYNLTTLFIDWTVPKDIVSEAIIFVQNQQIKINESPDIPATLKNYWGILLACLVLLLMVLLFPLCGFFFCCCRCCGKCGAKAQPADKRRDLCKKIILGTLLIGLGTGLLFCVVCAFASNQQLQEGINNITTSARSGVKDTKTYISGVKNQASFILQDNFDDFSNVFNDTLNNSSETVITQLHEYSKAASMLQIGTFVTDTLPKVNSTLYVLKDDTNLLRVYASQLNDAMRKVKKDLLNTLKECSSLQVSMCGDIMNNISKLETSIDFNKLPDVSEDITELKSLRLDEIKEAATDGMNKFTDIKNTINDKMSSALQQARVQITEAKSTIKTNLDNITTALENFNDNIDTKTNPYINKADQYINDYAQYRYYGGLAVSCIFLLITICIVLGLICGVCGKRPDGYSDNCCNKGAGSQFLICSVMIMFIFGAVIALIALVMLISGVVSQRTVCYPLRNPSNSYIIKMADQLVDLNDLNTSPSEILSNCYANKSAYETLNLQSRFNLEDIQSKFDISSELDKLNLDNVISEDFVLLSEDEMENLKSLETLDISNSLEKFRDELKENFTNFSLDQLSSELKTLVNNITQLPDGTGMYDGIVADLNLSILHLNTYNDKLLKPLTEKAVSVMNAAVEIDDELKMGHNSFAEAISSLIEEVVEAQTKLKETGNTQLKQIANNFKNIVKSQVDSYIYLVGNQTKYEVGRCGPLSLVINATLTSTCDKVILPWNGFWFSLFWALVLFLPTIIISVKLATLYKKYKHYGPYVETEYLYDAYADRGDSIPLNSRDNKRNKRKNKKSRKYEERPQNIGGEVVAREYATGSHPPDSRYADIAPKNWEEFPNGGPPQYQRAPTEYERPPPYYYPGSAGEQ